jgi:hypothetical protein
MCIKARIGAARVSDNNKTICSCGCVRSVLLRDTACQDGWNWARLVWDGSDGLRQAGMVTLNSSSFVDDSTPMRRCIGVATV